MSEFTTRLLIGGDFVEGEGRIETAFDPAIGGPLMDVPSASLAQVDAAIRAANGAYKDWARRPPRERSAALLAIASAIEAKAAALAAIESRNAGKPLRFVRSGELANVADVF